MTHDADPLAHGAHRVRVDDIELTYHVAGHGPVCLVHPGGPGLQWDYLRLHELESHLTLVYLEPMGTGQSERLADPREYTLRRYVRCVHELVTCLAVGPLLLLGHSHGGFVGLRCALDAPGDLRGLVLYDTAPTTGPEFWERMQQGVAQFAERHASEAELATVLTAIEAYGGCATDDCLTAQEQQIFPLYFADYWSREQDFAPVRAALRAAVDPQRGDEPAPFDVRGDLGAIRTPTLVVSGRYDAICGPYWAQIMADGIPGAELVILEQSGHFGHLEQPETFAAAIAAFAARVSGVG